jgi:hypothetical protein
MIDFSSMQTRLSSLIYRTDNQLFRGMNMPINHSELKWWMLKAWFCATWNCFLFESVILVGKRAPEPGRRGAAKMYLSSEKSFWVDFGQ